LFTAAVLADAQTGKKDTVNSMQSEEATLPPHAVLRLGTTSFRAPGEIYALAFSPDGKMLAAGGREKYVQVFDAHTGRRLHRLDAPNWYTTAVAFSPDSKRIAGYCFSNSPRLALWDLATGKRQAVSTSEVSAFYYANVTFTPDSQYVLLSSWNLEIRSAATGKLVRSFADSRSDYGIAGLAVTPDGKTAAVGGYPASRVFDLASGKAIYQIEDDTGFGVRAAAFTPDGKVMALGSTGAVKIVDVATGKALAHLTFDDHIPGVNCVQYLAFACDGDILVGHSHDGSIRLWNWAEAKPESRLLLEDVAVATVSCDGATLATACGNTVRLWDLATGQETTPADPGHQRSVTEIAFTADGSMLATSDRDTTCLWRLPKGTLQHTIPIRGDGLTFTPDGKTLAAVAEEAQLALVDVATGRRLQLESSAPVWATRPLGFTPDGRQFLAISRPDMGAAHVVDRWETASGQFIARSPSCGYSIRGANLTANGTTLISHPAGAKPVQLTDLRSGKLRQTLLSSEGEYDPESPAYRIGYSNGLLLIQYRGSAGIWEIDSSRRSLMFAEAELSALSPDGRLIATTEDGGRITPDTPTPIHIWDAWTGRELLVLKGTGTYVASLSFTPDGRHLASGLDDGTTLLWDVAPACAAVRQNGSRLTAAVLNEMWKTLADTDPAQAYAAMGKLAATSEQAIALLGQRLQPVPESQQQQIDVLMQQLDSPKYAERESAMRRLASLREAFEDALWQALVADPPLEVYQRLQTILARPLSPLPPDTLRNLRAIRLLEWLDTPDSQRLLTAMAAGAAGARETNAARTALARSSAAEK